MKFNILFIFLLLLGCSPNFTKFENREVYNTTGFALIYNEQDFEDRKIKGKMDNSKFLIAHKNLKINTLIKLINPKTNDTVTLKNFKRVEYPDFYKIIITEALAEELNLNKKLPVVELLEIRKNKSFVAKKAKIFNEEKKISSKAPVTSVQISNISKNKISNKSSQKDEIFILIATFYSKETAEFLKKRIIKKIPNYNNKKLMIRKKNDKEIDLISGPYNTVNLMKNDYIELIDFGFEELDIFIK